MSRQRSRSRRSGTIQWRRGRDLAQRRQNLSGDAHWGNFVADTVPEVT